MPEIETFLLERNQSEFENTVEINLTESGVEPLALIELLSSEEIEELLSIRIGYNYTEGTPNLRKAIATWYPGASEQNVLVTTGAAEANFLATWELAGPGDTVVVVLPNFMQVPGIARALGAEIRAVYLRPEDRWSVDRKELERSLDKSVRLVVVCNPNNPTGAVLSADEAEAIIAAAEPTSAWLLVDEVYRGLELGGRSETGTFWGRYDRTLVTSSTSKCLAHPGLRLGWIIAPEEFIYRVKRRQDYTTIGTSPISQYIAEQILRPERREQLLRRSRARLDRNIGLIDAWIARWGNRLHYVPPVAGGMAFIGYDFAIGSNALSERLRKESSVFIVAGDWFGLDRYLRIGIGGDTNALCEGLLRTDAVLRTL